MSGADRRRAHILIVDDDELVLSSLRGVFTLQTDYDVLEATDPRQAVEQLKRTPVDVVISDFLMPQMNGIEFLKEVRRQQPEAVRLLLTGYADKENAIKAINEVGLYHYLEKPWDNDSMLNIIRNALEEKSLRRQLSEKVAALGKLLAEHTDLANRHRFLERELDMAARVQRSLLPDRLPSVKGYRFANVYRPSEVLGGDFYDYTASDQATVILVSDVIGHGIQAALTTMLLKGIFQEAAAETCDPVGLLTDMNARLHRIIPEGMYAAGSLIRLEPEDPRIRFANAGLPYPFVLRASEKRLDEIVLAGPPLGLFGDVTPFQYEARELGMEPGDVLLVGSDGLGSIAGANGEFFEDRRLRQLLAELAGSDGERVIETLMESAAAFGDGNPLPDDVNLVAITRS
ncbi:MAG: PP2C family protein-serine/threonine phosphatase [Acidobacteriota bacterium]